MLHESEKKGKNEKNVRQATNRTVENYRKRLVDGSMVLSFLNHHEIAELAATTGQTVNSILQNLVRE